MKTKLIDIQDKAHSEIEARYLKRKSPELYNWCLHKVKHYKRSDRTHHREECDFHARELYRLFKANDCYYCGDSEMKNKTLERLDNKIGHIKTNCVVACIDCNTDRNDKVSAERYLAFNKMLAAYESKTIGFREKRTIEYAKRQIDRCKDRYSGDRLKEKIAEFEELIAEMKGVDNVICRRATG